VDKWREDSPPGTPPGSMTTRTVYVGGAVDSALDLWHDLSVTGDTSTVPAHTVFIIPRPLVSASSPDSPDSATHDIDNLDNIDNEEIIETDEEVLEDDDCLDPPD
jgi:hypothetical protein